MCRLNRNLFSSEILIHQALKLGSIYFLSDTLSEFLKNPKVPGYLKNRESDFETGEDRHLTGSDLELRTEFDVKKLKMDRTR